MLSKNVRDILPLPFLAGPPDVQSVQCLHMHTLAHGESKIESSSAFAITPCTRWRSAQVLASLLKPDLYEARRPARGPT